MSASAQRVQETFIARAFRLFKEDIAGGFARSNKWRENSVNWVEKKLDDIYEWEIKHKFGLFVGLAIFILLGLYVRETDHKVELLVGLAVFILLGLMVWFIVDLSRGNEWQIHKVGLLIGTAVFIFGFMIWLIVDVSPGKLEGDTLQKGVGNIIGETIMGFIISPIIALATFGGTLLANKLFKVLAPVVLFFPLIVWVPIYALVQTTIVLTKLLLLIPLAVLFVFTRLNQLYQGIFYTCPSRQCAYRGLPIYECSKCGAGNRKLWPNLYGLLWHYCLNCEERLPTLDLLGRSKLNRRCGGCEIPLMGKHAGRARERLVAIIGGPGSGKTNYLLMAVSEIVNGSSNGAVRIRGEIDEDAQAEGFWREWQQLAAGMPVAKTSEVLKAFLLYADVGGSKSQLYLYDAPGEEFTTVGSMGIQQYFPLIEGFILLVDPFSFESVRMRAGGVQYNPLPLQDVVNSTLGTALKEIAVGRSGKIPTRVAIAISKADLESVKEQIGDISQGSISGEKCRDAIVRWGGENAIRAIEHRFESVEYFACSPLGREFDSRSKQPLKGIGVMEPLSWVLTGQRSQVKVPSLEQSSLLF